jgi:hypothetical protein
MNMRLFKITLSTALLTMILLFFVVPSFTFAVQPPKVTPKLNALINQAKSTYLKPMGMDFNTALNQYPDALSVAMGLALQKQMQYVDQGRVSVYPYSQLRRQATEYLQELAQRHNYRHPTTGAAMGKDQMEDLLMENAAGFYNDTFIKKYGIDPSMVDLPMIIGDKPVQNKVQDLPAFHQQEDNNEIILFGQKIKAAEGPLEPKHTYTPPPPQPEPEPESITGCSGTYVHIWTKVFYGKKRRIYTVNAKIDFKKGNVFKYVKKVFIFVNGKQVAKAQQNNKHYGKDWIAWKFYLYRYDSIEFKAYDENGAVICSGSKKFDQ